MEYMQLFDAIKNGKLGRLYLLHGPEEFTKEQALSQLTEQLTEPQFRDLNYQMIDGTETNAGTIIAACETLPFLSERRLIVVKNYSGLGGKKDGDEEALKKYLERIPESTCLVFYHRGDADKNRTIYKAIKKHGEAVEFVRLKNPELVKWTAKTFRRYNKEISREDLNYFLIQAGNSLEDIHNEIQKLSAYAGSSPRITREAIDNLITPSPEYTVFQLIDAVSVRRKGEALQLLEVLLESGQSVFGIITLIARQVKTMLLCKDYVNRGISLDTAQSALKAEPYGLHPYAVKKGMDQSRNFTMEQLRDTLEKCLELDYGIKSGKIKERIGIEMLVIKMCIE
jgi:DNA polymerase-3 subunit delta